MIRPGAVFAVLAASLALATDARADDTGRPPHFLLRAADPGVEPFPVAAGPGSDARRAALGMHRRAAAIAASTERADAALGEALAEIRSIVRAATRAVAAFGAVPGRFVSARGTLTPPAGTSAVRAPFGMRVRAGSPTTHRHTGITFESGSSSDAVSVAVGVVVFAAQIDGFGGTVIVAHDDEYLSVYANLAVVAVVRGDIVEAGSILGRVGAGSPIDPDDGLYLELRHQGLPVDPAPWLSAAGVAGTGS